MQIEMESIRDIKPRENNPRLNDAPGDAATIADCAGRHRNVFGSLERRIFAVPATGKVASLDTVCFNCPVFGISPNGIWC
jgi:hypothetical protein